VAVEEKAETEVEGVKRTSAHLRGTLATGLDDAEANFSGDNEQLLKFHGIYSQDDRDVRRQRALAGEPLAYSFMIRVAIPGGRLTPEQWLALDQLASEVADGTLRLTTRQAVQFHGVRKAGLRPLARKLDEHLMTSFGACGDVVRNVVTCPGLMTESPSGEMAAITDHLAATFKPATTAHWEIFVEGKPAASKEDPPEHPFYGDTYLPRKFKIAIAHPGDNCVDVFAQDLGLVPGDHPDHGPGFTVLVGGGLGRAYANPDTFARLADPLTFVTYGELDELIVAVLTAYRDLGDRTDRRRARMKYVVADLGLAEFRAAVEARLGHELRDPLALMPEINTDDHLGWRQLPDGTLQIGIRVSSGRVKDVADGTRLRSALRRIAEEYPVSFYVTPQQDILVAHVPTEVKDQIDKILADHDVASVEALGSVERNALACPALPTCSQALAESERRLPELVGLIEDQLTRGGLEGRRLQLRMTGCPNGCARPAVAEIGVVGRTKSTYDVFLGGGPRGDRLAKLYQEKVKLEAIPELLEPLFESWRRDGLPDESFGDFMTRLENP
jgi:sulfite reductase (ferredoxin)